MPQFPDDRYEWRDTYYIWFKRGSRPTLAEVEAAVRDAPGHLLLESGTADAQGRIESLIVISPQDHAALEIRYHGGDEIAGEIQKLADELGLVKGLPRPRRADLAEYNARFDVSQYEDIQAEAVWSDDEPDGDEEPPDEAFDPGSLMTVLDTLIEMTGGMGVDPQSGVLL